MQFTCRVKSLSRAPRYSTHAFLVYFPACIVLVLDGHCKPLFRRCKKKKVAFISTPSFLFHQGFEVLCEKEGGFFYILCGIKLHFEGECCHASHTRRSGETNRARFIKQRELLGGMGNAGC